MSQLHKDKYVCWSEAFFRFWSSNVFPIQKLDSVKTKNPSEFQKSQTLPPSSPSLVQSGLQSSYSRGTKFEFSLNETVAQRQNMLVRSYFPFFRLAMFFQFKNKTAFRLKIHLNSKNVKHCHHLHLLWANLPF